MRGTGNRPPFSYLKTWGCAVERCRAVQTPPQWLVRAACGGTQVTFRNSPTK